MKGKKRRSAESAPEIAEKKQKSAGTEPKPDLFDGLPDDLVISVLCHVSSTASSPSDLISVLLTCKRMNGLGRSEAVLARVSRGAMAIRAEKWSESSNRFLESCCDVGNLEACYILGMIRFYCLENRAAGAALMARAALGSHAPSLFSLAVIRFNGSGSASKLAKDPRGGMALVARAAHLGHVDSIRELGHCLVDMAKRDSVGHRILMQAALYELIASKDFPTPKSCPCHSGTMPSSSKSCPYHMGATDTTQTLQNKYKSILSCLTQTIGDLLQDINMSTLLLTPCGEFYSVNRFLRDWFRSKDDEEEEDGGLRMCSNGECGRRETRKHEFRRCAACSKVNYCSRACQTRDWRVGHKETCRAVGPWGLADGANGS